MQVKCLEWLLKTVKKRNEQTEIAGETIVSCCVLWRKVYVRYVSMVTALYPLQRFWMSQELLRHILLLKEDIWTVYR